MKLRNNILVLAFLATAACCSDVNIPDPELQLEPPPTELMEPPEQMKPIPEEEPDGR